FAVTRRLVMILMITIVCMSVDTMGYASPVTFMAVPDLGIAAGCVDGWFRIAAGIDAEPAVLRRDELHRCDIAAVENHGRVVGSLRDDHVGERAAYEGHPAPRFVDEQGG